MIWNARLLVVVVALIVAYAPMSHAQSKYPSKPIQVQVVFPAGGPSDTEARIMAKHAEKVLGQRLIIQNVAGAGGVAG